MSQLKDWLKDLKMNETNMSMVLGALVILLVIGLLLNYVRRVNSPKGEVTTTAAQTEITATTQSANGMYTYTVVRGDSLYHIGIKLCNNPYLWPQIANQNQISNPHLIYPDQILTVRCQ